MHVLTIDYRQMTCCTSINSNAGPYRRAHPSGGCCQNMIYHDLERHVEILLTLSLLPVRCARDCASDSHGHNCNTQDHHHKNTLLNHTQHFGFHYTRHTPYVYYNAASLALSIHPSSRVLRKTQWYHP